MCAFEVQLPFDHLTFPQLHTQTHNSVRSASLYPTYQVRAICNAGKIRNCWLSGMDIGHRILVTETEYNFAVIWTAVCVRACSCVWEPADVSKSTSVYKCSISLCRKHFRKLLPCFYTQLQTPTPPRPHICLSQFYVCYSNVTAAALRRFLALQLQHFCRQLECSWLMVTVNNPSQ